MSRVEKLGNPGLEEMQHLTSVCSFAARFATLHYIPVNELKL